MQELITFKNQSARSSRINSTSGLKCQLDSSKTKGYSNTLGFYNDTKSYYSYDTNDNCITIYYYAYDTLVQNWFKTYKYTANFNSQNIQQDAVRYNWNNSTNSYENNFKLQFYTNAASTVTLILQQNWNGMQWVDLARTTMNISSSQKTTDETNQIWNATNSNWENQWKSCMPVRSRTITLMLFS